MSFVKRFKERKLLSPVLNVEFPRSKEAVEGVEAVKPKFTFQISRFPQQELNGVIMSVKKQLGEGNLDPDSYSLAYNLAFFELLKKHIKGWVYHKDADEEDFPFSKDNLKALDEMDYTDAIELIISFMESAKADEDLKKNISPQVSERG